MGCIGNVGWRNGVPLRQTRTPLKGIGHNGRLFRIGQRTCGGKTESVWLSSGDVVVMGGEARLTYHGVDRIRFGSSDLLPRNGRINLTLRVTT